MAAPKQPQLMPYAPDTLAMIERYCAGKINLAQFASSVMSALNRAKSGMTEAEFRELQRSFA
jgi:hypothetical protein